MTMKTMKVADIRPYWRNPRKISDEAVTVVEESLKRYGYRQPIVVDPEGVVIAGHTRLKALQRMGVEEVAVKVADLDEEKAREFRIVDNKTGEMTPWDQEKLAVELREFDEELLDSMFDHVDLHVESLEDESLTDEDVERAESSLGVPERPEIAMTTVECPSCREHFRVRTDSLPEVKHGDV